MSETPRFQSILRIFLLAWHPQSCSHFILKAPTYSPNRDWSCVRLHGNQTFLGNIWMHVLHPQSLWSWKPNQLMCSTRRTWSAHGSNNWSARGPKVSAGISPQKVETFPIGCDWFWKVAMARTKAWESFDKRLDVWKALACPSVARWPMLNFWFYKYPKQFSLLFLFPLFVKKFEKIC